MDENATELSPEEAEALHKQLRDEAFYGRVTKGWVWDEDNISYVPPFPPPDTRYPYLWNEETLAWDPFPGYPRDDNPE